MERILSIQNISGSTTINGVLLPTNAFYYPDFGFWLNNQYLSYHESPALRISLTNGTQYTYTGNTYLYTQAWAYTKNFVQDNYDMLTELANPQAQVITTGSTTTPIVEFSLPNGQHAIEWIIEASTVTDGFVEYNRGAVQVVGNIHTVKGSTSQTKLGTLGGGSVRSTLTTTTNAVRINVNGQNGKTITWKLTLIRK